MKKIIKLSIVLLFAVNLSAQSQCFTTLKSSLYWTSRAFGASNITTNTPYATNGNESYSLPFDAADITFMIETTILPFNQMKFTLKNGTQLVTPLTPSTANPYYHQQTTQPARVIIGWNLPKSLLANNNGLIIEAECIGYPNSAFTTCRYSGTVSSTIPPLVVQDPTFSGNPCITGNNFIIVNATGGGGRGTYLYSYTFNGTPYNTGCMDCSMGNTKGMGNYSVTVTSAGLSQTKTFQIVTGDCSALNVTGSVVSNATCTASNGSAKVVATGGTGVYAYNWKNAAGQSLNPPQTTATATNLSGNTSYTCEVTSGNTTQTSTVTIPQTNTVLNVSIKPKPRVSGPSRLNVNNNNNVQVNINNALPTANTYTYLWSTGATTASIDLGYKIAPNNGTMNARELGGTPPPPPPVVITPAPTTTYTVTVTDRNGCTGTASYVY